MQAGIIKDFQTRIEGKEKLFTGEVYGMSKMLFSKYIWFFNIYKIGRLVSRD